MSKDLYKILGVSRWASALEVRQGFRKLLLKLHPDKNPDPMAAQQLLDVIDAYKVLNDDYMRWCYDNFGENHKNQARINQMMLLRIGIGCILLIFFIYKLYRSFRSRV